MNKFDKKNNKGFTIVETLVAIGVLMLAIVGPLTVANKGYIAALDAKYESVAINYSQEALEYMSYIKDNHLWGNWYPDTDYESFVDSSFRNCTVQDPCDFSDISISGSSLGADITNMVPSSVFISRKFYLSLIATNQVLVSVETKWKIGNNEHTVTLNQILTNYER